MLRIKEMCRSRGVSAKALAEQLGITYQTLHSMAKGNPKLETIGRIAQALGCEAWELMEGAPSKGGPSSGARCPVCGTPLEISAAERR